MATFKNFFTATIYGDAGAFDAKNGGWQSPSTFSGPSYRAFPLSGYNFITVSPAQTVSGVFGSATINTLIEVIPSGLNQAPKRWMTDSTFANLYTQGA